jgi:SAM-dependent methyltransferase
MATEFDNATEGALRELDALLADREGHWWDSFYENRARPCSFFGANPDESLVGWVVGGLVRPGRALDVGCGNGRNAIFLSRSGFVTEGVDYSQTAIAWAKERVAKAGVDILLHEQSVFELDLEADSYDFIYDSGCFHHIAPHRRGSYVALVSRALKPGGWFGLACFKPEGGSGYSDEEVYERRSMDGGLGYTEERLREIWSSKLRIHFIRQMDKPSTESGLFGESFLWVLLAQKT